MGVTHTGMSFVLHDQVLDDVPGDCLDLVFRDGVLLRDESLETIRKRLAY